ncbi:MAG: 50S ribosomal protein L25 [Candidatus Omnitrophota bacterium]
MERAILNAEIKQGAGKSVTRKLRSKGLIPGVIYSKDKTSVHVTTDFREFVKLVHQHGENAIIELKINNDGTTVERNVIIKEIQYDTLKQSVLHIDFQQIKLTEKIKINVPLVTKGAEDCPGVKEGGNLEHILRELEVECLPTNIPHEINIDVTSLNIGEAIHVKELELPDDVVAITDGDQIVVLVKREKEQIEEKSEEAAPGAIEPEVIKQKKPEEAAGSEKK